MMCQTIQQSQKTPAYENLLVEENHKLLYCPSGKIASTNWRKVLLVLRGTYRNISDIGRTGKGVYKHQYKTLISYPPSTREELLRTYTKFTFSRHPFSRVLSAYRNKLVSANSELVPKYKEAISKANNFTVVKNRLSFKDFVKYLLSVNPSRYNSHWNLIYHRCTPCAIDYDIIGNFETLNEDAMYILKTIYADNITVFPSYAGHRTNSSSTDTLREFYSQISKEDRYALYRKYEMDFQLFDYDADMYL